MTTPDGRSRHNTSEWNQLDNSLAHLFGTIQRGSSLHRYVNRNIGALACTAVCIEAMRHFATQRFAMHYSVAQLCELRQRCLQLDTCVNVRNKLLSYTAEWSEATMNLVTQMCELNVVFNYMYSTSVSISLSHTLSSPLSLP